MRCCKEARAYSIGGSPGDRYMVYAITRLDLVAEVRRGCVFSWMRVWSLGGAHGQVQPMVYLQHHYTLHNTTGGGYSHPTTPQAASPALRACLTGLCQTQISAGFRAVFRTVQSVRPGGRAGRTTAGSPSFFKSMDGLGQMEVGLDALPGPVGPYGILLLHFFSSYTHKLEIHDFIPLMRYDLANRVMCVNK